MGLVLLISVVWGVHHVFASLSEQQNSACSREGQFVLHPSSRCKYLHCTLRVLTPGGRGKFTAVPQDCPLGTAVPRALYMSRGESKDGRETSMTLCTESIAFSKKGTCDVIPETNIGEDDNAIKSIEDGRSPKILFGTRQPYGKSFKTYHRPRNHHVTHPHGGTASLHQGSPHRWYNILVERQLQNHMKNARHQEEEQAEDNFSSSENQHWGKQGESEEELFNGRHHDSQHVYSSRRHTHRRAHKASSESQEGYIEPAEDDYIPREYRYSSDSYDRLIPMKERSSFHPHQEKSLETPKSQKRYPYRRDEKSYEEEDDSNFAEDYMKKSEKRANEESSHFDYGDSSQSEHTPYEDIKSHEYYESGFSSKPAMSVSEYAGAGGSLEDGDRSGYRGHLGTYPWSTEQTSIEDVGSVSDSREIVSTPRRRVQSKYNARPFSKPAHFQPKPETDDSYLYSKRTPKLDSNSNPELTLKSDGGQKKYYPVFVKGDVYTFKSERQYKNADTPVNREKQSKGASQKYVGSYKKSEYSPRKRPTNPYRQPQEGAHSANNHTPQPRKIISKDSLVPLQTARQRGPGRLPQGRAARLEEEEQSSEFEQSTEDEIITRRGPTRLPLQRQGYSDKGQGQGSYSTKGQGQGSYRQKGQGHTGYREKGHGKALNTFEGRRRSPTIMQKKFTENMEGSMYEEESQEANGSDRIPENRERDPQPQRRPKDSYRRPKYRDNSGQRDYRHDKTRPQSGEGDKKGRKNYNQPSRGYPQTYTTREKSTGYNHRQESSLKVGNTGDKRSRQRTGVYSPIKQRSGRYNRKQVNERVYTEASDEENSQNGRYQTKENVPTEPYTIRGSVRKPEEKSYMTRRRRPALLKPTRQKEEEEKSSFITGQESRSKHRENQYASRPRQRGHHVRYRQPVNVDKSDYYGADVTNSNTKYRSKGAGYADSKQEPDAGGRYSYSKRKPQKVSYKSYSYRQPQYDTRRYPEGKEAPIEKTIVDGHEIAGKEIKVDGPTGGVKVRYHGAEPIKSQPSEKKLKPVVEELLVAQTSTPPTTSPRPLKGELRRRQVGLKKVYRKYYKVSNRVGRQASTREEEIIPAVESKKYVEELKDSSETLQNDKPLDRNDRGTTRETSYKKKNEKHQEALQDEGSPEPARQVVGDAGPTRYLESEIADTEEVAPNFRLPRDQWAGRTGSRDRPYQDLEYPVWRSDRRRR